MTDNVTKLVRKNIKNLTPYQSARRLGGDHANIRLNANELPTPIFYKLNKKSFNRYPECQPYDLISSYSDYVHLPHEQILATRGADEGIELLTKSFCEVGEDAIIYCPPTYDMYRVNAKIFGIKIKEISSIKNTWQLDLLNIQSNLNKVKLIYICNPNNPTGNIIHQKDIIFLLNITLGRALVVIDEAYIEFYSQFSMTSFIKNYPNLVILRTLSKSFGLAGIRCGFVLAQKEIIKVLNKVISPYPVPIPVSDLAIQALEKRNIQFMIDRISDLNDRRIWLIKKLKNISCIEKVFNSNANYILVRCFMFEEIFQTLWNKGIILRKQNDKINLNKCLRISIGTESECLILIKELEIFSNKQNSLKEEANDEK